MTTISHGFSPRYLADIQSGRMRLRERMETVNKPSQRSTNEHVFQRRLESHLYDVKMKKPWRTPMVHTELRQRHVDNREILSGINTDAMRMYMGLISGLGYRQQARVASNVFQMSKHLEALSTVSEQLASVQSKQTAVLTQNHLPSTAKGQ